MVDEHVYTKIESWVDMRKWFSHNLGGQVLAWDAFIVLRERVR